MTTLFLDLSGRYARVLLTDGDHPVITYTLESQATRPEDIRGILAQITKLAGHRIDRAHLIVPDREVTASTYKLQEMPLADAEKIILRRIGAATGESEPLFHFSALNKHYNQQTYLAEHLSRQAVALYLKGFAEEQIRLKTITTPLQAILAALAPLRTEMLQPQAVFNIDGDTVATLFLSSTEIFHYSRIAIPATEDETLGTDDPGRDLKRKLFGILNLLHGVYSQYMLDNPQFHVGKVWLCGSEAGISGLPQSLADAMDIEVDLLSLLPGPVENNQAFAALAGLLRVHDDPERINFIPDDALRLMRLRPQLLKLAAVVIYTVALASLVVITEGRVSRLKNDLLQSGQELKALEVSAPGAETLTKDLDFLKKLGSGRVPFYDIFKDLAEHLPDTVFLDGIRYQKNTDSGTLELILVTADPSEGNKEAMFSAITKALDRSPYLSSYADPVIAIIREGETRLIQVTIACTVPPSGGTRR